MNKTIKAQFFVLLIGMIFAWSNFTVELFDWLNQQACTTGCSLTGEIKNPFLTPCFYGAIFFTIAFFLSLLMLFMDRRRKKAAATSIIQPPADSKPADPAAGN
jgi:hypothetical protein